MLKLFCVKNIGGDEGNWHYYINSDNNFTYAIRVKSSCGSSTFGDLKHFLSRVVVNNEVYYIDRKYKEVLENLKINSYLKEEALNKIIFVDFNNYDYPLETDSNYYFNER